MNNRTRKTFSSSLRPIPEDKPEDCHTKTTAPVPCCLFFQGKNPVIPLIALVDYAEYDQVETIISEHPTRIFQHAFYPPIISGSKTSGEWTSPLKRALKNCDTYMWKLFLEKIRHHEEYMGYFKKQVEEQAGRVDLTSLFAEYADYEEEVQRFGLASASSQWLSIGEEQYFSLPMHMCREFCRLDDLNTATAFDTEKNPRPSDARALSETTGCHELVSQIDPDGNLGNHYTLARGTASFSIKKTAPPSAEEANLDKTILQKLYSTRAEDRFNLLYSLTNPHACSQRPF